MTTQSPNGPGGFAGDLRGLTAATRALATKENTIWVVGIPGPVQVTAQSSVLTHSRSIATRTSTMLETSARNFVAFADQKKNWEQNGEQS